MATAAPREARHERPVSGRQTVWMSLWTTLQERLDGRDAFGHRGTLRWLEGIVGEAGGHAGTVRNILYKDLGALEEKRVLFETLADWHSRVGLRRPEPPEVLLLAAAKQRLGTQARGVFTGFVRELSEGRRPQQVVVGRPRHGTETLLEELRAVVDPHVHLAFVGNVVPGLLDALGAADFARAWAAIAPRIDARQPYAVQAAAQAELRTALGAALERLDRPLLAIADAACTLAGCPFRGSDGTVTHPSWWVETLLEDLRVPYLVALSRPPQHLPFRRLEPPTRTEAVRFLRERLRDTTPDRTQELVDLAGCDYAELARVARLEACRRTGGPDEGLLRDPELGPILRAFSVLSPPDDPWIAIELLEAATGFAHATMSRLQRSLVEPGASGNVRSATPDLLPGDHREPEIDAVALAFYEHRPHPARQLRHARRCGDRASILSWLRRDPALLTLVPGLWEDARGWPAVDRDRLASIALRHHAVRRQHDHPEVLEALAVLRSSPDGRGAVWANLELAEAYLDTGRFEQARDVLDGLGDLAGEERARALLGRAALARWCGAYGRAEDLIDQIMSSDVPAWMLDRAQLWRGLIAKDRGDLAVALDRLARVAHKPLMVARARYHVGDTLLFLGQPHEAAERLDESLRTVESEGAAEELARVRARHAAAMRLLGRYDDAAIDLEHASRQAPDEFSRQRVAQEASALEAARGHGWEALCLAAGADRYFGQTPERPGEARFRRSFARYRLAAAQRALETGDPYRPPFRRIVAPRAAATLRQLIRDLSAAGGTAHREGALRLDALLLLATCVDPEAAVSLLEPLRRDPSPVHAGAATIATAQALAAMGRAGAALAAMGTLTRLPPDPGLSAWATAACADTQLRLGRVDQAAATIDAAADLPAAFREQLGRAWGTSLLDADVERACVHWGLGYGSLPLPDALAWGFASNREPRPFAPCASFAHLAHETGPAVAVTRPPSEPNEPDHRA